MVWSSSGIGGMTLRIFALLVLFFLSSDACPMFEQHCDFSLVDTQQVINCYFVGEDPPNQSKPVLSNLTFDAMFSADALSRYGQSCPQLILNNIKLQIFLEPCYEVAKIWKDQNKERSQLWITRLQDPSFVKSKYEEGLRLNEGMDYTNKNCTRMIHNVQESIFTEKTTKSFNSGISIASWASVLPGSELQSKAPVRIPNVLVTRNTSGDDGTCNVFGLSMPDISLSYMDIDNTKCVESMFPGGENGTALKNALEIYGPDQLEIIRISKYFDDYDPLRFKLEYLNVETWAPYRRKYPGRSLISVDAKNSKKYPPDPITVDNSFFDAITDLHTVPVHIPYANPDNVVEGAWICCTPVNNCTTQAEGYSPNLKYAIGKEDGIPKCQPLSGDDEINATMVCPSVNDTAIMININSIETVKCIDKSYVTSAERCAEGSAYDPVLGACTSTSSNRVNSRPIDIVMWNFRGAVTFGDHWDSVGGRIFTVLVFGNREITGLGHLRGDGGEAFEDVSFIRFKKIVYDLN